jgi:hypothetical protein
MLEAFRIFLKRPPSPKSEALGDGGVAFFLKEDIKILIR